MKKILLLLAGTLTLMYFTSCDDEQDKDEIPPEVLILYPTGAEALSNAVNIQAEVNDNIAVKQWKIYIDDELLEEGANETISVEWDSKTVVNGDHVIKIMAIDAAENEGVSTIDVEVLNDTGAPQVEISTITDKPFVKGNVNIHATATDDLSIASLQLFVDDVLVEIFEDSSLNYEWNTTTVTDGPHVIKVVATDANANSSIANMSIEVFNYFFTIDLVNPQVHDSIKLWYFISREDGSLIQAKPYVRGENKILFETPDDYQPGQTFTFSQFFHQSKNVLYFEYNTLSVSPAYFPGTYHFSPQHIYGSSSPVDGAGYHVVKVTGINQWHHFSIDGEALGNSSATPKTDHIKCEVYLYEENAKGYVVIQDDYENTPRFALLNNLQPGDTTILEWSSMAEMQGSRIPASPDAMSTFTLTTGYGGQDSYTSGESIWRYFGSTETFYHHFYHFGNVFPEYQFYSSEELQNGDIHDYVKLGNTAPSEYPRHPFNLNAYSLNDGLVDISFSGRHDFLTVSGSDVGNFFNYYSMRIPKEGQFVIPEIPAVLTSEYGFPQKENLNFKRWTMTDYTGFDGYEDYIEFLDANQGSHPFEVSKENWTLRGSLSNNGNGRLTIDEAEEDLSHQANSLFGHQPLFPKMQLRK